MWSQVRGYGSVDPALTLVDSHCHLDDRRYWDDREVMIERARAAGVETMLSIGTGSGPPDLEAAVRVAEQYSFCYATVGVHPHDASKADDATWERMRELCAHPKVVMLGEIGLDYHYDFSPRDVQRKVFVRQLELAREAELPISIHTREAWKDTVAVLRDHWNGSGVFHCFTSGPAEADEALQLGFHLGIGGVLTFPRSDTLREAVRMAPADRLLLETDAPYLAPVPYRGKRNEPAYLLRTLEKLAEVREESQEKLADQTTANFRSLCLR